MVSPIPLLIVLLGAAYVFAVLKTIAAALDAPIGYEDENGFHYGIELARVGQD